LNYVVTPNAIIQIFERIVDDQSKNNKSFTLIGNYGTGKSTFYGRWKELTQRKNFSTVADNKTISYDFIKLVGDNTSLTDALLKALEVKEGSSTEIVQS
jgi:hypothetical protein